MSGGINVLALKGITAKKREFPSTILFFKQ